MLEIKTDLDLAASLKLLLFAFFILTRAVHPLIIDLSKHEGHMLYAKNTVVVTAKVSIVLLVNAWAYLEAGIQGVRTCWQPRCLGVFGILGIVYALGDFLEMHSMAKLGGGVYQILLQSKMLITALMLWWLKGTRQTPLQSHVLLAMFLAMSSFVIADTEEGNDGGAGGSLPLLGMLCVMLKVIVSCYCAVLAEKYLKAFSYLPFYAKMSGLSCTWAFASVVLCFATERKALAHGFYANWNIATWLVVFSFIVKTLSTQYLLQKLDSVQKNIGEALAVIVIYVSQVWMSSFDKTFNLGVFLLAILVVALVKTYLLSTPLPVSKGAVTKRVKCAKRVNIVQVNPQGTQMMRSLGRSTLRCEVEEALPSGVFYGMLGGVHPVCGSTHPTSANECELMLLGEPPASETAPGRTSLPYMPQRCLTVFGQVRNWVPKEALTPECCEKDVERATAAIAGLVEAN